MSSLGILLIIIALFLLLNADKLAWVFMGHLQLNTAKALAYNPHDRNPVP